MNCESVLNVEDLYLEDRLSPGRRSEVAAHLETCASCKSRLVKPALALPGGGAPKSLKDRLKKNLIQLADLKAAVSPEPAPATALLSPHGEAWPVLVSAAIYMGLALALAWLGPGVKSQAYESAPSGYGRMSP